MLKTTKSRHKHVLIVFEKWRKSTETIDEAERLTAQECGYTQSYVHQIRMGTLKKRHNASKSN